MSQVARRHGMVMAVAIVVGGAMLAGQASPFNWHDDYTEYNLLEPSGHQFHIVYYLTQRQAGAETVLNQTRSGSEGSDIAVTDPRTGQPLVFVYRTGAELMAGGETRRLSPDEHYIQATLPRPVPEGGEGRVRIEKTYLDERSYFADGDDVVFERSLGIGRNAIVLPSGYRLVSVNTASQVVARDDGRVKITFENVNGYAADVRLRARADGVSPTAGLAVVERPFDFSKTLYTLGDPASHEVFVRHEYTEATPGARSTPAFLDRHRLVDLTARDLDTGGRLIPMQEGPRAVIALTTPIGMGLATVRIQLTGTEFDTAYRTVDDQLEWTKALHEPRTTILLPIGWQLVSLSAPAVVTAGRDGGTVIQVVNPRVEPMTVALRAARSPGR